MNGRDIFEIWAQSGQERWTRFAKPSLFVNMKDNVHFSVSSQTPHIPTDISLLNDGATAIVVDLPGESGVQKGIALAKIGFRPVPLYNVVEEDKIGFLRKAVDNEPIINELKAGAKILQSTIVPNNAPPAFLLDFNRSNEIDEDIEIFDNRWNIDFEDMPDAEYMKRAGINRMVVWSSGEINKDLLPIIESYQSFGIEIMAFSAGRINWLNSRSLLSGNTPAQDDILSYENARFALLLIFGLSLVNLFFMFFVRFAPLFWTAPSIMWLTYLWVPEIVGDALAVVLTGTYFVLYILSLKRRKLMLGALAFFCFDVVVFYLYVLYYGIEAWIFGLGLLLLAAPIFFLVYLIRGAKAQANMSRFSNEDYFLGLDMMDGTHYGGAARRRHFRVFRGFYGYRGYGGGGDGGDRGYGGYRGGFRGGFGG